MNISKNMAASRKLMAGFALVLLLILLEKSIGYLEYVAASSASTAIASFVIAAIIMGVVNALILSRVITRSLNPVMVGANNIRNAGVGYGVLCASGIVTTPGSASAAEEKNEEPPVEQEKENLQEEPEESDRERQSLEDIKLIDQLTREEGEAVSNTAPSDGRMDSQQDQLADQKNRIEELNNEIEGGKSEMEECEERLDELTTENEYLKTQIRDFVPLMKSLAEGDLTKRAAKTTDDELGELADAYNDTVENIQALAEDAGVLAEAGIEGKLDVRADASKHGGDFRKIVDGVNDTLDAVIGPLNVAAEYVDRISKGDIPEKITDEYKGDFNEVKNNLNTMIDRVGAQISNLTSIPTPIMTIDREFNVTYMNTVGARLVGLTPEQCEGKKCYDLFKTPHCQTSECRCTQAMQRDEIVTGETVADPNGLNMPIQYTGAPIKDRDGNMIGALEYVVDITKTKEAMDDASEKVEYLNNVPTPVMVIDKEMNVQFMNPAGAAAVGRAPEACVGQKCFSLFNTEHCNTAECRTAKAMQENGTFTGDTVAKLPSGDLPIRYTGAPIKDAAGNVIGGLEYVTDISEEAQTVAEVGDLVEAALAGNLDARGNPDNYSIIGFKNIVQGLNDTLDAVVGPINEVVRIVNAYSEGKLDARVEIDAQGEFKALGETLDQFGEDLQAIITEVARLAGMAADGDLTVEAEVEAKGEFNDLVNSVNALTGVLSDTVVSARGVGGKVLGTAQQLASAAEEMNTGMEQLASASQQVAEGSQKLAELAQETARNVEDVAAQIDQTSVNASKSAEKGQAAVQISHEVQEAAQKTLEGLAAIQEGITKTSETVSEMNTAIERVDEMGNTITDVAGQTNMLGLNAAIEAARAGEAGRGFAVVADAVKNLAEKVKDAAGESGVAIEHIQESGKNAIDVSKTAVEEATRGGELLHVAVNGVGKSVEAMDEVSAMVQEIDSGAKHVAEVIKKVVAGMDEVASISEESASASEESSSAVQQQTSAIQELTSETQGLADIAQELMDELNRFTVREAEA